MREVTYAGGTDYERVGQVAYAGFLAFVLAVVIYAATKPRTRDPSNSKAFGCYITADAAPIRLSEQGMVILQPSVMRISFHLERHKTGIALTADAPIAAERTGSRYEFSIRPPGIGRYLDFFNVVDGRRYGVFDDNELRQFTMLARDGVYLPYRRVSPDACRA